jgi:sugar phosphate isomerase/epimerase
MFAMKIGLMNRPREDLLEEIGWIGKHHFDFVDLHLAPPAANPHEIYVSAVKETLEKHRLGVVVQTPAMIPLGSPLQAVRRVALEEFRCCLHVAQQIGAGTLSTHFAFPDGDFSVDEIVSWHIETLAPLCKEASEAGVEVLLENSSASGHHQFNFILSILDKLPGLGFHLSTGHAKLEVHYDRFAEYLQRLGKRLMHVQLSDNDGTADQHLPLGSAPRSTINWPQHIHQLKENGYDGTMTLKVFSPEMDYVLLRVAVKITFAFDLLD